MKYVDPPFELGETLAGTAEDGTTLINDSVLGTVYEFPAQRLGVSQIRGAKGRTTGRPIVAIALRNTGGFTMLGKRIATLDTAAGYGRLKNATGYTVTVATDNVVFIDPFLPATGVADDDIFWGILSGPTTVLTANAIVSIASGDRLIAGTGTTSQATTAAGGADKANAATLAHEAVVIARAMSARTTNETNTDLLVMACIPY